MPDLNVIFPEGSNNNWKWMISEEDEDSGDEENSEE